MTDAEPRDAARVANTRVGWIPLLSLIAALGSMLWAGTRLSPRTYLYDAMGRYGGPLAQWVGPWWRDAAVWADALWFASALGAILLAHEMGHFVVARRYGVRVSWPVFLPGPPPFGTFGAFIRMDDRQMPVRALVRIAAAGPFAGIVVALPVLLLGLSWSVLIELPEDPTSLSRMGSCLLFAGIERIVVGPIPEGHDVLLHPLAFAGWVGCFVTAFNLIPVGQLDGGHLLYALVGERFRWVGPLVWGGLVALGVFVYLPWLFLAGLLLVVLGIRHPPMVSDGAARGRDRWIAWASLALFALTFTPRPFLDPGLSPSWMQSAHEAEARP